ncbi:hypothetical protein CDEST_03315 [Colletotrichum destructivum]|uniref:Uncharacterized protein n=1 Tax=Colletotrichum destructivum TaxID=34406 RepID=A0AAX4I539_9PEZI|nr:hypothetical protein CDEST_03315 [Colletotrichum destructivum]
MPKPPSSQEPVMLPAPGMETLPTCTWPILAERARSFAQNKTSSCLVPGPPRPRSPWASASGHFSASRDGTAVVGAVPGPYVLSATRTTVRGYATSRTCSL